MNKQNLKKLIMNGVVLILLSFFLLTTCSLEGDLENVRIKAGLSIKKWITHSRGNSYHTAIGSSSGNAVIFTVAQRFTPSQLADLNVTGAKLTRISFMPNEANATYSVRVWTGGSVSGGGVYNPGTLVYSGAVLSGSSLRLRSWNDVTLTTPVTIPSNQELWIGYHINTQGGYPAGADVGPRVEGFGDVILWNNVWTTMTPNYNWMLRGFTE